MPARQVDQARLRLVASALRIGKFVAESLRMCLVRGCLRGNRPQGLLGLGPVPFITLDARTRIAGTFRSGIALFNQGGRFRIAARPSRRLRCGEPASRKQIKHEPADAKTGHCGENQQDE